MSQIHTQRPWRHISGHSRSSTAETDSVWWPHPWKILWFISSLGHCWYCSEFYTFQSWARANLGNSPGWASLVEPGQGGRWSRTDWLCVCVLRQWLCSVFFHHGSSQLYLNKTPCAVLCNTSIILRKHKEVGQKKMAINQNSSPTQHSPQQGAFRTIHVEQLSGGHL